jgi:hypothetical protein
MNSSRLPNGQFAPECWQPVHSSNIDAATQTPAGLYVRFKGGAIYRYKDVDGDVLSVLVSATPVNGVSAGHELHVRVKQASCPYQKVA